MGLFYPLISLSWRYELGVFKIADCIHHNKLFNNLVFWTSNRMGHTIHDSGMTYEELKYGLSSCFLSICVGVCVCVCVSMCVFPHHSPLHCSVRSSPASPAGPALTETVPAQRCRCTGLEEHTATTQKWVRNEHSWKSSQRSCFKATFIYFTYSSHSCVLMCVFIRIISSCMK